MARQQNEESRIAQIIRSVKEFFSSKKVFKNLCILVAIILIIVGIFATLILGGLNLTGPGGLGCSYKSNVKVEVKR